MMEEDNLFSTARKKAIAVLHYNATRQGFLAAKGGYDSLWARDGALTILGVLTTDDAKLHRTARATLETLKRYQRADGLIPNHITMRPRKVFYGGNIGRISAIDANLWYVIAALRYASKMNDRAFLRTFRRSIEKALDYTAHLDSNNDHLLEVPESSDWMDLFPRSGNVLTEDVLHYGALSEAARLFRSRPLARRAADVRQAIRRSYALGLKGAIPPAPDKMYGVTLPDFFTDTPYLLSHLTAFGFSWRLDVLGNILAALFGVLDRPEAKRLLRYLLSISISKPYPVKVFYPPIYPGDPDWRDYMAGDLQNIPHSYHNGGIWPYVGGIFVVFLVSLGERKRAKEELSKLAWANRQGISGEWEFNEWLHGVTGKPMGKRFQAWSAAGYLLADKAYFGYRKIL
jgi:glycogen debranching enzyme